MVTGGFALHFRGGKTPFYIAGLSMFRFCTGALHGEGNGETPQAQDQGRKAGQR
jgi:hypothetical protein